MNESFKDYKKIVLDNTPLIDVRAPIEFENGAFLNAVNLPILTDKERHVVGICFKEKGNDEATKLGYKLVSGQIKEERVKAWIEFIKAHPESMMYCFRGGSRSRIASEWIYEATKKPITRVEGGYKAFRNYLLTEIEAPLQSQPLLLSGYTGAGKTTILSSIENTIDLEKIANHRGSSFGNYITPQPTPITFENNLAYELIKFKEKGFQHVVIEDESANIGRNRIPKPLFDYFRTGDKVIVEVSFEARVSNTFNEYVVLSQRDYLNTYKDQGLEIWSQYILKSIENIRKRLGDELYKKIVDVFNDALKHQINTNDLSYHKQWIELLLIHYYDPMYEYQMNKATNKIVFKGSPEEVIHYIKTHKSDVI